LIILRLVLVVLLFSSSSTQAQGTPQTGAGDPQNITLVVEAGDHYVSVLDGDTFDLLDRFPTPVATPVDLKFSPDMQYAFVLFSDGWLQKYDILASKQVTRVRAGNAARQMAISADGQWLAVIGGKLDGLMIFATGDMLLVKTAMPKVAKGALIGLTGVYDNPLRESFILPLTQAPKIWEVFYGAHPPAYGFAHDWRIEGPVPQATPFPDHQITTAAPLGNLAFDSSFEYVAGGMKEGGALVTDLVIGLQEAVIELPSQPDFAAGFRWLRKGQNVMAVPHPQGGGVSLIDTDTWTVVARIPTQGGALFVRSGENSDHLWVGVSAVPKGVVLLMLTSA